MSKLKDQNDSDKFKIIGVKKDIEKLETQIVRSPQRLKKVSSASQSLCSFCFCFSLETSIILL